MPSREYGLSGSRPILSEWTEANNEEMAFKLTAALDV